MCIKGWIYLVDGCVRLGLGILGEGVCIKGWIYLVGGCL